MVLYTLMSYFPSYIKDVYEVSVSEASLMILFPYLLYFVIQILTSPLGDYLIKKGFKVLTVRKIFVCGGGVLTGVFLIIGAYMNTQAGTVAFMTLSVGFSGIPFSGFNANMLDVTSKYSGMVMGISNTFATVHIFFNLYKILN